MSSTFFKNSMAKWAMFVMMLFVVWFAGWFLFASWADGKITTVLSTMKDRGIEIVCEDQKITGFPFRGGIHCTSVSVDDAIHDFSLKSGTVRSAAQLYAPTKNIIDVDGPLDFENRFTAINADWELLRTYVEIERGGFQILSTNYRNVKGTVDSIVFSVSDGALHSRQKPGEEHTLDVAATANKLALMVDGNNIVIDGSLDVSAKDAYRHFIEDRKTLNDWVASGAALDVRHLVISPHEGEGRLMVKGPVKVEADGSLTGEIKVGIENQEAFSQWIAAINPEFGPLGVGIGQAMSVFGKIEDFSGQTMRAITLEIDRGEAKIGFLEIGKLPSVY